MADPRVIAVPRVVVEVLATLNAAVGDSVMLAGGWAVHCRLVLVNRSARPTEDVDIALRRGLRPARAALEVIHAVQDDPTHVARLIGLPLIVDLLADDAEEALRPEPGIVQDADGLQLVVPPFADLFSHGAELIVLDGGASSARVVLPGAGALFASKLGGLYLEFRLPEKRASDALDALSLLEAYGPSTLAEELLSVPSSRRQFIASRLEQVGFSGLAAQTRVAGGVPYPAGAIAVDELVRLLRVG